MTDQRDRSIEILLRQDQRDGDAQATNACVDAESLAAWMEDGLSAEARGAVEKHASGCARCQALLASMARAVPYDGPRPWWRTVTAKLLVPAAAIATALLVWISVGREPPAVHPAPSAEASRRANPPENPAAVRAVPFGEPVPSPSRSAPPDVSGDKQRTQVAQNASVEARAKQTLAPVDSLQDRRAAVLEPKASVPPLPIVGGTVGAVRPQDQAAAENARTASPPPSAPAPPLPAAGRPPATSAQPTANVEVNAKPSAVGGVADAVTTARQGTGNEFATGRGSAALTAAALEIQSPDADYRWRILPPAGMQRSTDRGTTWSVVDPLPAATRAGNAATTVLTAGSSPSRDVCWVVGRAGVVLLSTDGATWQRRAFAEQVDLTGVHASDAQRATVTTTDGRQFVTADGGATWMPIK